MKATGMIVVGLLPVLGMALTRSEVDRIIDERMPTPLPPTFLSQKKGAAAMEKEIKTVQDYLTALLPYRVFECPCKCHFKKYPALLFRGIRYSKKDNKARLVASIGENWKERQDERERTVLKKIQDTIKKRFTNQQLGDWDALALARHYGVKTRYLDWSSNCLTALWFAVSRKKGVKDKDDVVSEVWVLRTCNNDFEIPTTEKMPIPNGKGSQTKLFEPTPTDKRIGAQDSYMMRQVYEPKDIKEFSKIVSVERNEAFRGRCWRIPITTSIATRKLLRKELEECGYDKSTIFPENKEFQEIFSPGFISECNSEFDR